MTSFISSLIINYKQSEFKKTEALFTIIEMKNEWNVNFLKSRPVDI